MGNAPQEGKDVTVQDDSIDGTGCFCLGLAAVGDVLAGEKFKLCAVRNVVQWEQVEVGDQEGDVLRHCGEKGNSEQYGRKGLLRWLVSSDGGFFGHEPLPHFQQLQALSRIWFV